MWQAWVNWANGTTFPVSKQVKDFILTNMQWIRSNANNPTEEHDYWSQVGFYFISKEPIYSNYPQVKLVLDQFDGLYAGYNGSAPADQVSYKLSNTQLTFSFLFVDM
jgi:hypothetical protein